MNMELLETNGKYVIPLDTVDLSLLSTLNVAPKHHNDLLPLWSKNNLTLRNEDCYLEFEIKDKQDISDTDTYYDEIEFEIDDKQDISESKATYVIPTENSSNPDVSGEITRNLCYICNIEVPLPYMKEHINSTKHKTFLKITEVALERVKKQVAHNFSDKNPVSSMYFCQTCVTTTPVKDKSFHMKSTAHKNAVILDRILNDFLKIYTHDELETDNTESEIETPNHEELDKVINKMLNANCTKICNDEDVNKPDIEKPVCNKDITKEIVWKLIPITFQKINEDDIVSCGTNLTEYINNLNAKTLSSHKVKDVNGEYLIIETKDGSQLKVTHNNFHGVSAMGKRHAQCKLCTEIVKNLVEHMYSQKHFENIVLPINDKECIRELDNTKSHCILCNELVESADSHALCNKRHKALLKNSILLSEQGGESQIIIETRSDVNKPNIITPLESNEEQVPKDCAAKTTYNNINNAPSELEKNEFVIQLDASKTDRSKAKNFFCSVCQISLRKKDIRSHIFKHKAAEKRSTYMLEYSIEANNFKCVVCNCFVDTHIVHLMSTGHIDRYNALLAANKMITTQGNVFCEACTIYMCIGNELVHIDSTKHKKLLLDLKSVIVDKPTKEKLSTEARGYDSKQHFCVICQVNVPNNSHNISTHRNEKLHKHNLANVFDSNGVSVQENNKNDQNNKSTLGNLPSLSKNDEEKASGNPPAEIFSKDTPSGSVAKKILVAKRNGKLHIEKDSNSNSVTRTANTHDNKTLKSVTSETVKNVLEITLNPSELKCRICLVIIPNKTEKIQKHLNGYDHNYSARILLVQNRLELTGNLYFCDGCREPVNVGDQFDHIKKRSHAVNMDRTFTNDIVNAFVENQDHTDTESNKDNTLIKRQVHTLKVLRSSSLKIPMKYFEMKLTDNLGVVTCQVCNVKVPHVVSALKIHVEGRNHVEKLQEMLSKNKILTKNDRFNCSVCQKYMRKEVLFNHVKNQNHVSALAKTPPNSICKVCNIAIIKGKIAEHVLTTQHINNVKKKNEITNYLCEICDVQLTNNATNINEHNDGLQHKNNLKQIEVNNIEIKECEMKKKCYCNTCEVYFACKSVQEHILTSKHLILSGSGL
ncbi:unnamed protein product [Parnassius mnemosyne]|uniref:Matrin-type domain-containing protein n=1 Tax=Parnassius mnemosyne TaxID=213953 RepID=A0AAV1LB23_9NEOP